MDVTWHLRDRDGTTREVVASEDAAPKPQDWKSHEGKTYQALLIVRGSTALPDPFVFAAELTRPSSN